MCRMPRIVLPGSPGAVEGKTRTRGAEFSTGFHLRAQPSPEDKDYRAFRSGSSSNAMAQQALVESPPS